MYLKLKENKTFTNPETGEIHEVLTGGIKLINIDVDNKVCNFLVRFYEDRAKMEAGKRPEFQQSFSINDTEEKIDFTNLYGSKPTTDYFGLDMEILMYNFILADSKYEVFEKVM